MATRVYSDIGGKPYTTGSASTHKRLSAVADKSAADNVALI